jgi:NSS family neurotransmitter:Na+ symporter
LWDSTEFFVAYVIALFLVGYPLLLIEMTLGKKTEKPAPEAFASFGKNGAYRFVGYWSLLILIGIIAYLSVVTSWLSSFLVAAQDMAWASNTKTFMYETVLRYNINEKRVLHLFIGCLAIWSFVWMLLRIGTRTLTRIVTFIMPIPFVCLFTMAIYGLFLENSAEGLQEFLMIDFRNFLSFSLWSDAVSQALFSLMIGFGAMFTYSSILRKNTDVVATARAIVLGNTLTAFVVGIAMYTTIGHMAGQYHQVAESVFVDNAAIAFVIFPEALSQVPIPGNILAIMFFASLIGLSLITFSLWIKTIIATIREYIPHMTYGVLALCLCTFCFGLTIPYTDSRGVFLIDIVDHFLINYGIVLIAFVEIILAAWILGTSCIKDFINAHSKNKIRSWCCPLGRFVLPGVLLVIIISNVVIDIRNPYRNYPVEAIFKYGVLPATLIVLGAIVLGIIGRKHHLHDPDQK